MPRAVRTNIAANYVGSAWNALMGIAFVPIYINYLGIEAYGLVGLFATLQAWLSLLDVGLSPTLSREMARLHGGGHTPESIRDLLRSIETIYAATAVLIAICVFAAAPWLSLHWMHAERISADTIASALAITGIVIAFRWIGGLYKSALGGLQEQVWLNVSSVVFATLKGVGVIGVLAFVSDSVQAYFAFQGVVAALEAVTLMVIVHRSIPRGRRPARFDLRSLNTVWKFAAGVTVLNLLSLGLSQVDKIILPAAVPLASFGYYVLATTVGGALSVVSGPIATAVGPRLAQIAAGGSEEELGGAYHRYSQLLALLLVPVSAVLVFFPEQALLLWTHNALTSKSVAPLLAVFVAGTAINALVIPPFLLQMAFGWTKLPIAINAVALVAMIPAVAVLARLFGAQGAALAWLGLNAFYLLIEPALVHRRLLRGHLWRWYAQDLLPPVVAVGIVLVPYYLLMLSLHPIGLMSLAAEVIGAAALAGISVLTLTPIGREISSRALRRLWRDVSRFRRSAGLWP